MESDTEKYESIIEIIQTKTQVSIVYICKMSKAVLAMHMCIGGGKKIEKSISYWLVQVATFSTKYEISKKQFLLDGTMSVKAVYIFTILG